MKKLLAANRSEIAVRIFRSATELGYRTVAIYANEDRFGVHRFKADESYLVGEGKGPVAAYLDIESIIDLAKAKGVDLIHPGYGFLSENAHFASACEQNGITFVGPAPTLLARMGDKIEARKIADQAKVPTLPGAEDPISDPEEALKIARKIGFPLIIKAAFGGGGRGMRVIKEPGELKTSLEEAQSEAQRAFGQLRSIPGTLHRARQAHRGADTRRQAGQHRAPARARLLDSTPPPESRRDRPLHRLARRDARPALRGRHADCQVHRVPQRRHGRIPLRPRYPRVVLHRDEPTHPSRAHGHRGHHRHRHRPQPGPHCPRPQPPLQRSGHPQQADIPRNGVAIQSRVTTEDPEKNFAPDYGKIVNYRSAAGFGIRLDGAMGDTGAVITPYYDSLLVKLTASASSFELAIQRMNRALSEMRIRGVKTNIPFVENVINHPEFISGKATTTLIDNSKELFKFKPRHDRATKLLKLLGQTIVNGNEQVKGRPVPNMDLPVIIPEHDHTHKLPKGTKDYLTRHGPEKFAEWTRKQKKLLVTDTTMRDAHQSLLAARMRSYDQLQVADAVAQRASDLFSLECWGGATFDTTMRFLHENPFKRLRRLRERIPNVCFQMLLRGANGVGYSNYPDNVIRGFIKHSAESGMDIFRVFDSLNYLPNLKVAMESIRKDTNSVCEAAICYTGDILDPQRDKYPLKYYVNMARELEKMGAHILAIKDMSGLCAPNAAHKLIKALRGELRIPLHFHTHDSSGIASASIIKAAEAGVDAVDLSIASLSGLTAQPNLNSIVKALQGDPRDTQLDLKFLNELSIYYEAIRQYYEPFDTSPKFGSAEVYTHEMPGGQYTNLREQARALGLGARWPEVVRYYHEVNSILGDIVKVTPSSKVVGDLSMFLLNKGVEPGNLVNLEPGAPFPESVVDMLSGGLGQPEGGWPKKVQKVILGDRKPHTGRPGARAQKIDLEATRKELSKKYKTEIDDDELFACLMYPQVFANLKKYIHEYGHARVLPTPAFFYGLKPGKEISVEIEEGKTLIVKLIYVSTPNQDGERTLTFELNGRARECVILDKSIKTSAKKRAKADPADKMQVGSPLPAMVSAVSVSVGQKVKKKEKLCVLEAMKMQTTVYALADGVVDAIEVQPGDQVDTKDLLMRLR